MDYPAGASPRPTIGSYIGGNNRQFSTFNFHSNRMLLCHCQCQEHTRFSIVIYTIKSGLCQCSFGICTTKPAKFGKNTEEGCLIRIYIIRKILCILCKEGWVETHQLMLQNSRNEQFLLNVTKLEEKVPCIFGGEMSRFP